MSGPKNSAINQSDEIGWLEPFDCDVEIALDQITRDLQIRGQIRFMLIKLTNSNMAVIMAMKEKVDRLREALKTVRALVDEQDCLECRGDEDCDHCLAIYQVIDPALAGISQ